MQYIGSIYGIKSYTDYAHHPSEIKATLSSFIDNETVLIFQPHTYSRTKMLMNEFIKALETPNVVVIYKTYPARESFLEDGDGLTLFKKLKKYRKKIS